MKMQVQRFSLPSCTLSPRSLLPTFSTTSQQTTKLLVSNLCSTSRLIKSIKRVSKLPSGFGNHGGLVRIKCGVVEKDDDGLYIRRCVEVARKAIGCTSPNPMVGCVIVKDGKVVGEGYHPKAGQPHAEVFALRDAGNLAENATAYVSLEPCNHYGRTPPCTEALIKAKVKRVVVGMVDPNPIVASKGVDRLKDAGIEVTVGIEEELCKRLNESYIHKMLTGKPFVTFRYSLSVNGHILNQLGEGAAEPGGYYSQLLQEHDAVILSSASIDDKFLFPASKEPGANQPLWVIAARNCSSCIDISSLAIEAPAKLIIFTDKEMVEEQEMTQKGIEKVVLDEFNLNAILEYCSRQGFCSVLIDSGGKVEAIEEFLQEGIERNLLQKVVVEVLPFWAKSDNGNLPVASKGLGRRLEMKKLQTKISGKSVVVEGYI